MKQLRNVSRVLVVLVLIISASSLFICCNQPSSSSSSSSSDEVVIEINGEKSTFSNFDKSKRSALCSNIIKAPDGEILHTMSFTITFNEDFTTVTMSDMKQDGVLIPEDPSAPPMMLPLVNGIATIKEPEDPSDPSSPTVTKEIDFNPVINKLK